MAQIPIATRLAPYRLTEAQVQLSDLRLERNQQLVLSLQVPIFQQRAIELRPQSLQDLKTWIGVSDEILTGLSTPQPGLETVSPLSYTAPHLETVSLASQSLHSVARRFVFGPTSAINPARIAGLDAWLLANNITVHFFPFNDIYLSAGSQLVVAEQAVIFARYITVEDTARIIIRGTATKIDCAGFQAKSIPIIFTEMHPVRLGG